MLICASNGVGSLPWKVFTGRDFSEGKLITAVDDETGYYAWEEPVEFGFGARKQTRYVERYAISTRIRIDRSSLTIFIL